MTTENPDNTDPRSLEQMLSVSDEEPLWGPEDLAAILRHQLDAPLGFDLCFGEAAPAETRTGDGLSIETFRELFDHPRPPIGLLEQTKQYAKQCRKDPEGPLPDEIATVLYILSIVVARLRGDRRISKLDDDALRHSLDWALDQPWLDAWTRNLLGGARGTLESEGA